jgi:hypothetical protein
MTPSPNQPTPRGPFNRWSRFAKPAIFALILLCCLSAGLAALLLARSTLNLGAFFPPTPTVPPPTPPCVQPKLKLGQSTFLVEVKARPADGALPPLAGKPGVAFWLDGTSAPYVFALDPTPATLALTTSLAAGDAVNILWGDCSRDEYQVSSFEPGLPADLTKLDHSGVAILVLAGQGTEGFVILAGRPQAPTATPDAGATEEPTPLPVDITFLHTTRSADGKTLSVGISVQNRGSTPLSLVPGDIALVPETGKDVPPTAVVPALPLEIGPGASQALEITFSNPAGATVVFRLKTFTVELYPTNS